MKPACQSWNLVPSMVPNVWAMEVSRLSTCLESHKNAYLSTSHLPTLHAVPCCAALASAICLTAYQSHCSQVRLLQFAGCPCRAAPAACRCRCAAAAPPAHNRLFARDSSPPQALLVAALSSSRLAASQLICQRLHVSCIVLQDGRPPRLHGAREGAGLRAVRHLQHLATACDRGLEPIRGSGRPSRSTCIALLVTR
jgi:hypothetical protein